MPCLLMSLQRYTQQFSHVARKDFSNFLQFRLRRPSVRLSVTNGAIVAM